MVDPRSALGVTAEPGFESEEAFQAASLATLNQRLDRARSRTLPSRMRWISVWSAAGDGGTRGRLHRRHDDKAEAPCEVGPHLVDHDDARPPGGPQRGGPPGQGGVEPVDEVPAVRLEAAAVARGEAPEGIMVRCLSWRVRSTLPTSRRERQ